MLRTQ